MLQDLSISNFDHQFDTERIKGGARICNAWEWMLGLPKAVNQFGVPRAYSGICYIEKNSRYPYYIWKF